MQVYCGGDKILQRSDVPQWNLLNNSKGPFQPSQSQIDNELFPKGTNIYMIQGKTYTLSAKTNGTFTDTHDNLYESNLCTIWLTSNPDMTGDYAIISDRNTTTGTTFIWEKPTGDYCVRVNSYRKDNSIKIWDIKIEEGNVATGWLPAIADLMLKSQE